MMNKDELWLTCIKMDTRNREVRRDLRNIVDMHRTVMSFFPDIQDDNARQTMKILHRLDIINKNPVLLIQSQMQPMIEVLPNGYGVAKYTSLNPLIKALRDGIIIRYRILANATKRQNTGLMAGKRIALGFSDTKQWWLERSTNAGLALTVEPTLVSETLPGISSKYNNILLRSWRIDGLASVNDVEKLVATLEVGIGRGRAYGCGMLSIAILQSG